MKTNSKLPRRRMRRLVRLAVFGLRSCLLLVVILASPVWIPLYLVLANLPEYWSDELSRWLPAWWANAKKAWYGESLPNENSAGTAAQERPMK